MRGEAIGCEVSFYFDEMDGEEGALSVTGDDIDFASTGIEISVEDFETVVFEEPDGEVFCGAATFGGGVTKAEAEVI